MSAGSRFIQGGRPRRLLHMAAIAATRHNPDLGRKVPRPGRPRQAAEVALFAIMRKLLLLASALLRQNRPWTPRAGDEPTTAPPPRAANRHTDLLPAPA